MARAGRPRAGRAAGHGDLVQRRCRGTIAAVGFILTAVTMVGIGLLAPDDGAAWRLGFGLLALGPLVGIVAMRRLRQLPEAVEMAGGRR